MSTDPVEIGIIVDAGPDMGYGHAVRCVRMARALATRNIVAFYPLSQVCQEFVERAGFLTRLDLIDNPSPFTKNNGVESASFRSDGVSSPTFPPLVITDLREARGITAAIHRHGSRHVSIHDLGLAQCHSDVAIDGSITRLFPFSPDHRRTLFLGPRYMVTRDPVSREQKGDSVLVTLGGGATAAHANRISENLSSIGLKPVVTRGFSGGGRNAEIHSDAEIGEAMSRCRFAIAGSGVTLYDLLASGVPTIAVAFDHLQLRTADAFQELGAVLSAGLLERLSPETLLRCCKEMLENRPLIRRLTRAGQALVDGKGLSRVVDIVRRQLWLTSQVKTFTGS